MTILEGLLAFYTPGVGLLDADWLQRVGCGGLIGWSLQRVTSLRHAVAAKVLLLGKRFFRLATLGLHGFSVNQNNLALFRNTLITNITSTDRGYASGWNRSNSIVTRPDRLVSL